jgi:hypothetical protein
MASRSRLVFSCCLMAFTHAVILTRIETRTAAVRQPLHGAQDRERVPRFPRLAPDGTAGPLETRPCTPSLSPRNPPKEAESFQFAKRSKLLGHVTSNSGWQNWQRIQRFLRGQERRASARRRSRAPRLPRNPCLERRFLAPAILRELLFAVSNPATVQIRMASSRPSIASPLSTSPHEQHLYEHASKGFVTIFRL